jgi:hypothetical protein
MGARMQRRMARLAALAGDLEMRHAFARVPEILHLQLAQLLAPQRVEQQRRQDGAVAPIRSIRTAPRAAARGTAASTGWRGRAYPIHPEVFDRLYTDWSTLIKFQRTRGVLRLMAAVIHSLCEKGDRNPLIMPCNIPIDDPRVRDELTRYLPDQWKPIIEKDVDAPNALPLRIDGEVPNLGKFAASGRVARTIYLGSAPTSKAANRGVEDRRIKLGFVMPGETPAVFGDALRRLSSSATFLYQDGARYWYSTQPTVTKLAEDRAEQLKRNPDPVASTIEERLRTDLRATGDFRRIHPVPQSGADVPDDMETRLVVLGIDHPYSKEAANKAQAAANAILNCLASTCSATVSMISAEPPGR